MFTMQHVVSTIVDKHVLYVRFTQCTLLSSVHDVHLIFLVMMMMKSVNEAQR